MNVLVYTSSASWNQLEPSRNVWKKLEKSIIDAANAKKSLPAGWTLSLRPIHEVRDFQTSQQRGATLYLIIESAERPVYLTDVMAPLPGMAAAVAAFSGAIDQDHLIPVYSTANSGVSATMNQADRTFVLSPDAMKQIVVLLEEVVDNEQDLLAMLDNRMFRIYYYSEVNDPAILELLEQAAKEFNTENGWKISIQQLFGPSVVGGVVTYWGRNTAEADEAKKKILGVYARYQTFVVVTDPNDTDSFSYTKVYKNPQTQQFEGKSRGDALLNIHSLLADEINMLTGDTI